jgi:hypothetical protein
MKVVVQLLKFDHSMKVTNSIHHACNLGHYLGSLVRLGNLIAKLGGLIVSLGK